MIKSLLKLGLWLVVGAVSISALLWSNNVQTPWQYTLHSTITPGTQFVITQPEGEPIRMKVEEGQVITGQKTFDIGAPMMLIGIYMVGSVMGFGLRAKRRSDCMER